MRPDSAGFASLSIGLRSFRQDINNAGCNVSQTVNPRGEVFAMLAPNDRRHGIKSVVAQRQIFNVAVVAGQNYCRPLQVKFIEKGSNEEREGAEDAAGCFIVLSVDYLISDKIFIDTQFVGGGNSSWHIAGF